MSSSPRVVIIGAGIVGTNLADELTRRVAFLEDLAERGVCDAPAVAHALRDFEGS